MGGAYRSLEGWVDEGEGWEMRGRRRVKRACEEAGEVGRVVVVFWGTVEVYSSRRGAASGEESRIDLLLLLLSLLRPQASGSRSNHQLDPEARARECKLPSPPSAVTQPATRPPPTNNSSTRSQLPPVTPLPTSTPSASVSSSSSTRSPPSIPTSPTSPTTTTPTSLPLPTTLACCPFLNSYSAISYWSLIWGRSWRL